MLAGRSRTLHVLLTHLQLDHIQGLMVFAPFFDPEVEITVWGPPAAGHACASASPATSPTRSHRGPTLGYRLTENATSLCYLPDHEPALGQDLATAPTDWISGHELARGASLLIHDGQYTAREYQGHRALKPSRRAAVCASQ